MPTSRQRAWLVLFTLWSGVLGGGSLAAPPVEPIVDRIDAVFGRPVVFPIRSERGRPPSSVEVRLDDGRTLVGQVQWVSVSALSRPCGQPTWLAQPLELRALPASDPAAGTGIGSWVLVLRVPMTGSGQGFWIEKAHYDPNWLPDPRRLASSEGGVAPAWSSPLTAEQINDPLHLRLVGPFEGHPLQGWRYELAVHGLVPGEEFDPPEPSGPVTDLSVLRAEVEQSKRQFEPLLDDLASLERARWQVALARLWKLDPDLSVHVRRALVGALDTPRGVLPLWRVNQAQLDDLLEALLRPRSSDEQRVRHVRAWLESLEPAVAWIIDDAGIIDAVSGEPRPTIGVVNFERTPVAGWARAHDAAGPSDLTPIDPMVLATMRGRIVPGFIASGAQAGPGVEVRVGRWERSLASIGVVITVAPPGFALGPFRAEWTLASWLAMDDRAEAGVARDQATAAMLFYGTGTDAGVEAAQSTGPSPGRTVETWVLYIEARIPDESRSPAAGMAGPGLPVDDFVEAWFGPFGSPERVIRIHSDGRVVNAQTGQPAPGFGVEVIRLSDRWVARLPIPADLIEPGGLLRIGVLREDGCGMRSSWPRRLLPGQIEPGRVAVQTRTWRGYETRSRLRE
ncbi:MAG: hypothetical protein D6695_03100 [Planctomycetota bacterium]|nr:MAG: hypothetical protein D6695_03100 [Planctomycetota bacterium]